MDDTALTNTAELTAFNNCKGNQNVNETTPLTADSVRFLAREGYLSGTAFEKTLLFLGLRPTNRAWSVFWLRILLTAGLLFCIAGVICFFAFNWFAMSHFLKFGVIIVLLLICGGLGLWRTPDSLTGGLGLLACGLLAGPLLAVYGQYYQTGADTWELFRAWSIFLILLAIPARQNALWLAAWIVSSLWAALALHQLYFNVLYNFFDVVTLWPFLLLQLLVLVIWEYAIWRRRCHPDSFLQTIWPVRIIGVVLIILLTIANAVDIIVADSRYDDFLPGAPWLPALFYIGLLVTGFWWYRRRRSDTMLLTLGLFSLICLFFVFLFVFVDIFNAGGMLIAALLLLGLAFGATRLALRWHRQALKRGLKAETETSPKSKPWQDLLFLNNVTLGQLFGHLKTEDTKPAEAALANNLSHMEPWYFKLLLTICGWLAAIFLIAFMGLIIVEINDYHIEKIFFIFALIFIITAAFLVRTPILFLRQFGVALALAGALVMPVSLVAIFEMESFWQFPILFTAILCFVIIRHPMMRAVAFFGVFMSCLDLWLVLNSKTGLYFWANENSLRWVLHHLQKLISVTIFAVAACVLLTLWFKEKNWITSPFKEYLIRPVLTGLIAVFAFMGLFSIFFGTHNSWYNNLFFWDVYYRCGYLRWLGDCAGPGAAVGLIYLARRSFRACPDITRAHKMIIYTGTFLCVFIGWWLPWLPIGLLLLALGRYLGNVPLTGFSVFYLIVCLLWYYFTLSISLLSKSYTLWAAGLLMLAAGLLTYHLFYQQPSLERTAHAQA